VISTRRAAIKAGCVRYYTGKPCKRGHLSERWTVNSMCIVCKYKAEKKPEYREHHHRFNRSPKGQEMNRRYNGTPHGQERYRRYNISPRGRQKKRDFDHRRRADPVKNRLVNDLRKARAKRQRKTLKEN
jgi:hypothetical protein